jgi:hypothetical protein
MYHNDRQDNSVHNTKDIVSHVHHLKNSHCGVALTISRIKISFPKKKNSRKYRSMVGTDRVY